jgi:hypothetical protein
MLGSTPDITGILEFRFWEPVYYAKYDAKFPADSTELLGRFVGIGEHIGHAVTFKILTEDKKVIHRSVVRSALKHGGFDNQRAKAAAPKLRPPKVDMEGRTPPTVDKDGEEIVVETVEEEEEDGNEEATSEQRAKFQDDIQYEFVYSKRDADVEKGIPLPTLDVSGLLEGHSLTTQVTTVLNSEGKWSQQNQPKNGLPTTPNNFSNFAAR